MATNKIHLLRQSAMEAGDPGKYYINPSEKLMSKASDWKIVEHEDSIELIFDDAAFGDIPVFGRIYNYQAIGDSENKDDEYGYIMNTDYLHARKVDGEQKDGFTKFYIPKIKVEENKKKVAGSQAK
ncbi:hypothetical protein C5167_024228 [Papaver somniferum]|uniref:Uncharacterized protein n=1 Tax=Papaver somniferum TaxID=3469 RepID=A0A4Y7JPI2_PAPSO|nr:uncharacterized protein LOC113277974 [Papaver somniferum]RZC62476.1 hypothetical protein C5167_024228 [Papaver somniferum]